MKYADKAMIQRPFGCMYIKGLKRLISRYKRQRLMTKNVEYLALQVQRRLLEKQRLENKTMLNVLNQRAT